MPLDVAPPVGYAHLPGAMHWGPALSSSAMPSSRGLCPGAMLFLSVGYALGTMSSCFVLVGYAFEPFSFYLLELCSLGLCPFILTNSFYLWAMPTSFLPFWDYVPRSYALFRKLRFLDPESSPESILCSGQNAPRNIAFERPRAEFSTGSYLVSG